MYNKMGLRFHRSIKIIPGVHLNLSKGMPSLSIGSRGLSYNIGAKGNKATVGLPGSGVSYSDYQPHNAQPIGKTKSKWTILFGIIVLIAALLKAFLQ